jgi:antitoxin (DNA-binding transcriptional repressor) of toxin-antitoxin stability system
MNVNDVQRDFVQLVNRVYSEGVSIDLERGDKVIARLTPAEPQSPLTLGQLEAFLRTLPSLDSDTDAFAQDIRAIRASFPAEANPWD